MSAAFDRACMHLLTLNFSNLFEAVAGSGDQMFRCKGCDAQVKRRERETHFEHHKRVEKNRREREALRAKQKAAANARAAKKTRAKENGR